MQAVIAVVFGLMVSTPVVAESLVEGWVRRSSGEPVEAAQVLVFDWTDLRRGAVAQATTDAAGYFALPPRILNHHRWIGAWRPSPPKRPKRTYSSPSQLATHHYPNRKLIP